MLSYGGVVNIALPGQAAERHRGGVTSDESGEYRCAGDAALMPDVGGVVPPVVLLGGVPVGGVAVPYPIVVAVVRPAS